MTAPTYTATKDAFLMALAEWSASNGTQNPFLAEASRAVLAEAERVRAPYGPTDSEYPKGHPMRTDTPAPVAVSEEAVKYMADRFLCWKLPANFSPDGGITFKKTYNEHIFPPMEHAPVGTNLFNAAQAAEMVRYMLEGLAAAPIITSDLAAELAIVRANLHDMFNQRDDLTEQLRQAAVDSLRVSEKEHAEIKHLRAKLKVYEEPSESEFLAALQAYRTHPGDVASSLRAALSALAQAAGKS